MNADAAVDDLLVRDWRVEQFLRLGFDFEQAELLVIADADHHEAERLIQKGCPKHLVEIIL